MTDVILDIQGLTKSYKNGPTALAGVDLQIKRGEIFALLGPNGAGKTTLIGAVCGLVTPTSGSIHAFGQDLQRDWRSLRRRIGLVPQELNFDMFETVIRAVRYSRGMFGCPKDEARIEEILRSLSLWEKRDAKIRELSGGMKRRVLIAKALSHDPELLFLDEPTAGVDVELRRDMWQQIGLLRARGTTVILTTHYIEEAEEMADRVGVINQGKILLVDDKAKMMAHLGRIEARIGLATALDSLPPEVSAFPTQLEEGGTVLVYRGADGAGEGQRQIAEVLRLLVATGVVFTSVETAKSSLEDIFVDLVEKGVVPADDAGTAVFAPTHAGGHI